MHMKPLNQTDVEIDQMHLQDKKIYFKDVTGSRRVEFFSGFV